MTIAYAIRLPCSDELIPVEAINYALSVGDVVTDDDQEFVRFQCPACGAYHHMPRGEN